LNAFLDTRDYGFDADRLGRAEPLPTALRRRFDGRYPVDPFGLDPQLCDLVAPAIATVARVEVSGGEHVPARGPAVLVANRGFGIFEPAALAVAVQREVGRRLRIVGAPALPFVGSLTRRLGTIHASEEDVAACLRSGHLVGVPLAHTWLRTGAGTPPLALMQATTHSPIVPVAVVPGGPFGTMLRPWRVVFGSLVTLPDPYDPSDPLTAARFAEAVRDSVRDMLADVEKHAVR
jgi:1-acyl-sn-glycerol-3-phosphate acyltransferase